MYNRDCKRCKTFLKSRSINNKKDFLLWAKKNHPDKGGSNKTFQEVSYCNDILFGINEECSKMPKSFSSISNRSRKSRSAKKSSPKKSKSRKSSAKKSKSRKSSAKEPKPCKPNQVRNPKTGRCVLKTGPIGRKLWEKTADSKASSGRKSSSKASSGRKASSSKRSSGRKPSSSKASSGRKSSSKASSGRKSSSKASSGRKASSSKRRSRSRKQPKPCRSDQVRNPRTNRCVLKKSPLGRKIMQEMGGSKASSGRKSSSKS
jgi:hypothetical protein